MELFNLRQLESLDLSGGPGPKGALGANTGMGYDGILQDWRPGYMLDSFSLVSCLFGILECTIVCHTLLFSFIPFGCL